LAKRSLPGEKKPSPFHQTFCFFIASLFRKTFRFACFAKQRDAQQAEPFAKGVTFCLFRWFAKNK
jgi:hypothetical protein